MIRLQMLRLAVITAAASYLPAFPLSAHDRTTSYSSWYVSEGQARVVLSLSEVELTTLAFPRNRQDAPEQYAVEHLVMLADSQPCAVVRQPHRLDAPPGRVMLEWVVAIPDGKSISICRDLFVAVFPGHLHFVNLHRHEGTAQRVLAKADRCWDLGVGAFTNGSAAASTTLGGYWILGVEHIATGYDHLVFLLALLLCGGTFGSLIKVVSGFTVGHSITLGMASLGLVRPEIGPIEALIGLSIVLVAVENVWLIGSRSWLLPAVLIVLLCSQAVCAAGGFGRISSLSSFGLAIFLSCYFPLLNRNQNAKNSRWSIALIFGLIHGFGFASILEAADVPADRLPAVLVSFNLGVEAGQVMLVAFAWPLLVWALARFGTIVVELGSGATLGLGMYWLVARAYC